MANNIHVLLVEHDSEDHDNTMKILRYFSSNVTAVKLASTAISMLSEPRFQFDLVITNMDSPDSFEFQLLHDAEKMSLLVVLMTNNDDALNTTRAIELGAFCCLKKPVTTRAMGYLWQKIVHEKSNRLQLKEQSRKVIECNTVPKRIGEKDIVEGNKNINIEGKNKSKQLVISGPSQNDTSPFCKKVWIEWTEELHEKFMDAVKQIGEKRCYPRAILELMNVPSLTRMQVASHLQRCRIAKWLPPSKRKSAIANYAMETTQPKKKGPRTRTKPISFGSMPGTNNNSQVHQRIQDNNHHEINCENFGVDPPIETNVLSGNDVGTSNNGQNFGTGEPNNHIADDFSDFPNLDSLDIDSMFEVLSELGMDSSGSLESLVLDRLDNQSQMPTTTDSYNQSNQEGQHQ